MIVANLHEAEIINKMRQETDTTDVSTDVRLATSDAEMTLFLIMITRSHPEMVGRYVACDLEL